MIGSDAANKHRQFWAQLQSLGPEFSVTVGVQHVLNEMCKSLNEPARQVSDGFDLGVRWAAAHPGLARDFIATTNVLYRAQGIERDDLIDALTRGLWSYFESFGALDAVRDKGVCSELQRRLGAPPHAA